MFLFLKHLIVSKSLKLIIVWLINIVRTDIALSALSVCQRPGRHVTSEGCCKHVSVPAASWILLQAVTPHSLLTLEGVATAAWFLLSEAMGPVRWSSDATIVLFHTCKDIQAAQSTGGSVNKLAKIFHCLNSGVGDRSCADCKWCSDGAAGHSRLGGLSLRYIGATW